MARPLVGIFVGGAGRRMGGTPKGLLQRADGTSLIEHLRDTARAALPDAELVLVGQAEAYLAFGIPALADDPPNLGPIGGLCALLSEAKARGAPFVIAVACDMPEVSTRLVQKLARFPGASVAPRQAGKWQPLFARYAPESTLEAARAVVRDGDRSLQRVLARLGTELSELPLGDDEQRELFDWDEPADLSRHEKT